jgi:hypothetical protein
MHAFWHRLFAAPQHRSISWLQASCGGICFVAFLLSWRWSAPIAPSMLMFALLGVIGGADLLPVHSRIIAGWIRILAITGILCSLPWLVQVLTA